MEIRIVPNAATLSVSHGFALGVNWLVRIQILPTHLFIFVNFLIRLDSQQLSTLLHRIYLYNVYLSGCVKSVWYFLTVLS